MSTFYFAKAVFVVKLVVVNYRGCRLPRQTVTKKKLNNLVSLSEISVVTMGGFLKAVCFYRKGGD